MKKNLFQRHTGTLMLHSQHLKFKRQIWKQMYLRYTGSLCVCVNLFVFWTLQTYSLFTNQRINNTHALKFSRCKPGDFLSMQASSCMAFMMEKHHSVHQLQKKPVYAHCLGSVDVWKLSWNYCTALAAKYLEVRRKM